METGKKIQPYEQRNSLSRARVPGKRMEKSKRSRVDAARRESKWELETKTVLHAIAKRARVSAIPGNKQRATQFVWCARDSRPPSGETISSKVEWAPNTIDRNERDAHSWRCRSPFFFALPSTCNSSDLNHCKDLRYLQGSQSACLASNSLRSKDVVALRGISTGREGIGRPARAS